MSTDFPNGQHEELPAPNIASELVRNDAEDAFNSAVSLLGQTSTEILSGDSDTEGLVRIAEVYESSGLKDRALASYEAALESVYGGELHKQYPEIGFTESLRILEHVFRVGGDLDKAFGGYLHYAIRYLEPQSLLDIGAANSPRAGGYDWPELPSLEKVLGLLDEEETDSTPAGVEANVTPQEVQAQKDKRSNLKDVNLGIGIASTEVTNGLAKGALSAYTKGRTDIAEHLLEEARVTAQMQHMPVHKVLEGVIEPQEPAKYNPDAAFFIAEALSGMGELEEVAELLLRYPRTGSPRTSPLDLLAEVIPHLLEQDPSNETAIDISRRFLDYVIKDKAHWDESFPDHSHNIGSKVAGGVLKIAVILQRTVGFSVPSSPQFKKLMPAQETTTDMGPKD